MCLRCCLCAEMMPDEVTCLQDKKRSPLMHCHQLSTSCTVYSGVSIMPNPDSLNQKLFPLNWLWSDLYLQFLDHLIFKTKFSFPRRFKKSVLHCTCQQSVVCAKKPKCWMSALFREMFNQNRKGQAFFLARKIISSPDRQR